MSLIQLVLAGQMDDVLKALALAEGADLDQVDKDGRTALMHATISNSVDIVRGLIMKGASIDMQDKNGYSAIHFAAQAYALPMVDILLSNGARVDVQDSHGNTPLGKALFASRGRGDVVRRLIGSGANINCKNKYGVSPLDLAKLCANYNLLDLLQ